MLNINETSIFAHYIRTLCASIRHKRLVRLCKSYKFLYTINECIIQAFSTLIMSIIHPKMICPNSLTIYEKKNLKSISIKGMTILINNCIMKVSTLFSHHKKKDFEHATFPSTLSLCKSTFYTIY